MEEIERIARLEQATCDLKEDVSEVKEAVSLIRDNHLAHIKDQITALDSKLSYSAGAVAAIVGVIELLAKIYK